MDLTAAIKKPFTNIQALLIGILLSILPIISWFAKGFIIKNSGVGKGPSSTNLPDWNDWGDDFAKGFGAFVICLAYMIPALIVLLIGAGTLIISMMTIYMGHVIPIGMMEDIAAGTGDEKALEAIITQNWMHAVPAVLAAAPIILLAILLGFVALYLVPAATLRYIATGEFGEAFSVNLVFRKAFSGAYFLAALMSLLVFIVLGIAVGWIPFLGRAITGFIGGVIAYTLLAQAYNSTGSEEAKPSPVKKSRKK